MKDTTNTKHAYKNTNASAHKAYTKSTHKNTTTFAQTHEKTNLCKVIVANESVTRHCALKISDGFVMHAQRLQALAAPSPSRCSA